jgi:SUF system FeS assembly protein, NifU family
MSDLRDLYQEVILDHNRHPRNCHRLEGANRQAEGFNPLCGDKVTVYLTVEDGVIKEVSFEGAGCAISTASSSLMTESLKGKREEEAEALFQKFHSLVMGQSCAADNVPLGKLQVLEGVKEYPSRVKCATLAWHTLHAALRNEKQAISTE